MTGLSWEMAGLIIAFQVLQALVAGAMLALLLWYEKRLRIRQVHIPGDLA